MIGNFKYYLYKFIRGCVHLCANIFCSFLPMNNEILLESYPDLACNTYPLFKYMLDKGLNNKIDITWMVSDPEKYINEYSSFPNVYFIKYDTKGIAKKIKRYIRRNRAKAIVATNRFVSKKFVGKKQLNIYIEHGSPIKDCKEQFLNFECDYIISQGPLFESAFVSQYGVNKSQIVNLGFPRNDEMFSSPANIINIYPDAHNFRKIIIWVPTFREHIDKKRVDVDSHFPLGIPILYSVGDVRQLNDKLSKNNILVIIKPHPAQDVSVLKNLNSSNIRLLYNDDLERFNVQTNELLAQTDAMIGDYSGIYFDYLLLDKPIGITLDDYEQYRAQKGMVYDDPLKVLVGEYIYTLDDLLCFADHVSDDVDTTIEQRKPIKQASNVYPYYGSTERVYNFIVEKLGI